MRTLQVGDQVRIDIPNKSDPDHDRLHRKHGTIIDKIEDNAGYETGILEIQCYMLLRWRTVLNIFDGVTYDRCNATMQL